MEALESGSMLLELKYCERCGGLWLRPKGSELIFCSPCALVMAGVALNSPFAKRRPALISTSQPGYWAEGGNA